jgi:serine/threonine protein kinase/class 3 adenylate cyclase
MVESQARTRLGVLLFTDVVGSTELKKPERLGGVAYQRLLERHNGLFESGIAEIGDARVIKHTGDGYFAEFPTASAAVRFALVFQSRMGLEPWGTTPLTTRVGIYVGEYLEVTQAGQPDVVGRTADLAARLMSLAVGGQILLTRQAFDDARQYVGANVLEGSPPVVWLAHGKYEPKGGEAIEVCEVGLQGFSPLSPPPGGEKVRRVVPEGEEGMFGAGYPRAAAGLGVPGKDGWVLEKKLGEGGFGEVWLAVNRRLGEKHVFKFCLSAGRLRSLQREFTLFRLLKGALGERPDIVKLHDFRLPTEGTPVEPPYYLESEYAAGGSLLDYAAALPQGLGGLPESEKLELLAKVADAVAAAHSVGVRHKDIKPGNVLLRHASGSGPIAPVLADFGIGFLAGSAELEKLDITLAGFEGKTELDGVDQAGSSRTGTRMYAPPEMLMGREFTTHGDVFALGVLAYQVLVGDLGRPFTSEWREDVADEVLREIIGSATARTAVDRPAAGELAVRLRRVGERRAVLAAEAGRLARSRVRARLFGAGLAVLVMASAVLATGLVTADRKNAELRRERDEKAAALDRESQALAREMLLRKSAERALVVNTEQGDASSAIMSGVFRDDPLDSLNNLGDVDAEYTRATRVIAERLAGRPVVQARAHFALVFYYVMNGKSAYGRPHWDKVREFLADDAILSAPTSLDAVESFTFGRHSFNDADWMIFPDELLRRTLAIQAREYGEGDERVHKTVAELASRLNLSNTQDKDPEVSRQVLDLLGPYMRDGVPMEPLSRVLLLTQRALALELRGDAKLGEADRRQAVAIWEKIGDRNWKETAIAMGYLGTNLAMQERWDEAVAIHELALRSAGDDADALDVIHTLAVDVFRRKVNHTTGPERAKACQDGLKACDRAAQHVSRAELLEWRTMFRWMAATSLPTTR